MALVPHALQPRPARGRQVVRGREPRCEHSPGLASTSFPPAHLETSLPQPSTEHHARRRLAEQWAATRGGRSLLWPTGDRAELDEEVHEGAAAEDVWRCSPQLVAVNAVRRAMTEIIREGLPRREAAQKIDLALCGLPVHHIREVIVDVELADAYGHAAYEELVAGGVAAVSKVFRRASPHCCTDCRCLFMSGEGPRVYTLADFTAARAQLGNFGLPPGAWALVVGPVHPGCGCGPVTPHDAAFERSIAAGAAAILAEYRG